MEFGVIKFHKGAFKLYKEFNKSAKKVLNASNHWDALEEAQNLYPDVWINSKIGDNEGYLLEWKEYQDWVTWGAATDYDGYGYAYDKDFNFIENVRPSLKKNPEGAAFVLWFNR